jgi:hypothetical protein
VDATYDDREVFESDDLSTEARWPRFSSAVVEHTDVRNAMGIRLTKSGDDALGALDLYATEVDAFGDSDRSVAAIFAAFAAVAPHTPIEREQMIEAIEAYGVVGQAKDIIMERLGVGDEDALAQLVDASSRMNRKLRDVARGVAGQPEDP